MENFKRINKNSFLTLYSKDAFFASTQIIDALENDHIILQIVCFDDTILVEAISNEKINEPTGEPTHDIDFENYLETVINNDPFGAKYTGKPIKAVFEAGDREWLDNALKNMKNAFIRDRLQYIVNEGGYGKIICK